jgi:cation diffusion facilitator CzcD-associated flavoprotein CzcO
VEHVDVLVVGAGLSGIGAAARLELERPGATYAVLEARDAIGGTWDLFRYPGVRSDSDMHTLGYPFRPWQEGRRFADGPAIRGYVQDTARDLGVLEKVRLHHRVLAADWRTEDARWTVHVERTDTGERFEITCSFLLACTGYYRYDQGHVVDFPGLESFAGPVVHPQHWPADLDVRGKRVVVIGSGATAVTLVPSMADEASHVVMLQRSPSYVTALPSVDGLAQLAARWLTPDRAYKVVRAKNIATAGLSYKLSQRWPKQMRSLLMRGVAAQLPEGYDVETHFGPSYGPWDQRLCVVPDGDLFTAIREGRASVVTGRIARFEPGGIRLESGELVEADVVVTATGLELQLMGGTVLTVDGATVVPADTVAYKGLMLTGVPNFAFEVGYTNA